MTRRPFLLRPVEGLRPIPSTDLAVTEPDQLGHNGHDRAEDDKRHQQPGVSADQLNEYAAKSTGKTCNIRIAAPSPIADSRPGRAT